MTRRFTPKEMIDIELGMERALLRVKEEHLKQARIIVSKEPYNPKRAKDTDKRLQHLNQFLKQRGEMRLLASQQEMSDSEQLEYAQAYMDVFEPILKAYKTVLDDVEY